MIKYAEPVESKTIEKPTNPAPKKAVKATLENQVHGEGANVPSPKLDVDEILKKGKKAKFPDFVQPMLATLVDKPFDDPGWEYEIKWDGYRAIAFLNGQDVELKSRNNKSFKEKYYPITESLQEWGLHAVVDGEIVVVNEKGVSDFGTLQNWRSEADGQLLYYVFDVLWLNGKNLMGLPLYERKAVLQSLVEEQGTIRAGYGIEANGTDFFETAEKMALEGIIAKRSDSKYLPGSRSKDWLKIKVRRRQEVIIAGYTKNEGTPKPFSSLLSGVYDNGKLTYVGKVGTGFKRQQQEELLKRFEADIVQESPFEKQPDYNKPSRFRPDPPQATVAWLRPKWVCEINFTEITSDGVFRHPSFVALREDKNVKDVVREKAAPAEALVKSDELPEIIKAPPKSGRKTLLNPTEKTQVKKINGHSLKFTNLNKLYWPEEKIFKRDLINYYYQIAPYILPYLKNRPQSLNRFPNGIKGKSFYQKDVTGKVPSWMDTYLYHSEGDDRDKHFLVSSNEATLLYVANLGTIEMNPWSSTTKKPDHPTFCIIDLDPDDNTFEQVIEAARVTKALLDSVDLPCYCKTSGSTGLHVYIPLGGKYTYEESKEFARAIVTLVHREIPEYTSLERTVSARNGKMYLDFLQNRPQATVAAPYSLRPKPGATVSMPLFWDEVKSGLKMSDFSISNALARLQDVGDIFKPVLGKGIDLPKAMKALEKRS